MKLNLVQKGTHILPISEWNNDRPSPAEVVADNLQLLQHNLTVLVNDGGSMNVENLFQDIKMLNNALLAASEQEWKFTLDGATMNNPDIHVGDTVFYLDSLTSAIIETGVESIRYEINSHDNPPPWKTLVKLDGKWHYLCFVYHSWQEAYEVLKTRV